MASSIDNAFITQYGRRKPKMPQKRNRKPIPVPSHEELMEGRKKIKPYRPKPKPKPKKKKPETEKLIYRGEPLGNGKRSASA